MQLPSISALFIMLGTANALAFSNIVQTKDNSIERQLYNRNAHVVLQEPIERAQKRADEHAAKVKRGDYKPPHHPKYRPTGTNVPPLETGSWDKLALIKRQMEASALDQKVEAHQARSLAEASSEKRDAMPVPVAAAAPTGFEKVVRR